MLKPGYKAVDLAYNGPEYRLHKFSCHYENQCAIRMSIALCRCGFSLATFPAQDRVHGRTADSHCPLKEPHIVGAGELMKFLITCFGMTAKFSKREIDSGKAYTSLYKRHGILYFDNLGGKKGDHIDLFDGLSIYNEIRDYRDHGHKGGAPPTSTAKLGLVTKHRYFQRAQRIDFIELL